MENIIILILWAACSLLVMVQYAPYCAEMSTGDYILAGIIFIIGGPFFIITNILETILDNIMPEGWDQDNGFGL